MSPPPRTELMDQPGLPAADAERALADIERVYAVSGIGAAGRALLPRLPPGRQTLIDLGTGSGHLPARLARRARARGRELAVVGVDRHLRHLLFGRRRGFAQARVVADVRALPFRDRSVDWTLSTLLLHHFDAAENRAVLAEMRRVARRGAVVADLRRGALATPLSLLVLRLLRLGPVAAHDGRVSVEQAWTLAEVRALVRGDDVVELRRRWPFRFSLVVKP